jgi:DNA-binding MarR family transcriptional regulator
MTVIQYKSDKTGGLNKPRKICTENLIYILHLAGEGKLDRTDLQILAMQSTRSPIGYGEIAKALRIPRSTVQYKVDRLRTLMKPYLLKN